MKIVTVGLFAVAMLLNISVYFDANDSQNANLSLGSLKVSLFQKAYAASKNCETDSMYGMPGFICIDAGLRCICQFVGCTQVYCPKCTGSC